MIPSLDYAQVGLRVGLEVHQQLLTDKKMFCRCPAGLYTQEHDGAVLRHMRPTLSELGEYDGTALMEFKTRKKIVYLLHESNVCTYEMDDTPPFLVNPRAIDIAIEQCLMLGCDIVDEVHIARKQYLDGSIPTGFQRTAIVGVNGSLPFRGRKLSIIQVSVEEDSCREVQDRGHLIIWRTDRLGMPLVETVTGPDLRTPEEVEEAILLIGRVCRSTGHVRVGSGASRQDVNVSVRGGRRVEIKGVSQARWAARLVHSEALRQIALLELRDELRRRGFEKPGDVGVEHVEVTDLLVRSRCEHLRVENWEAWVEREERRPGMELGEGPFCVRAIRLPGMKGILDRDCQPGLSFAHEIAGRVRVIATLDQQPILLHGDAWPEYPESHLEMQALKGAAGCGADDALIVVWGAERDTRTAAEEIRLRLVDALDGVPHETRQPRWDGTTDFERILPGPERMYPDTDSPPQRITPERTGALRTALPEAPWVREERYVQAGVPLSTVYYLIRRNGARLVDSVVAQSGADLRRACFFFGEQVKGLRRAGVEVDGIAEDAWCELFGLFDRRPVLWEARVHLVELLARDPEIEIEELVVAAGLGGTLDSWPAGLVDSLVEGLEASLARESESRFRYLMGVAMPRLRGWVPVRMVADGIRQLLAEGDERGVVGSGSAKEQPEVSK